ncbi:hypothetical protein ACNKHW_05870 [Shigella flexneri]
MLSETSLTLRELQDTLEPPVTN